MIRKIDTIFDELIEAIERGFDVSNTGELVKTENIKITNKTTKNMGLHLYGYYIQYKNDNEQIQGKDEKLRRKSMSQSERINKMINEITMPFSDKFAQVIDMSHMFPNDKDSKVNLSGFVNTTQVMDMSHRFPSDKDSKVNLSDFVSTSQAMNMSHMFPNDKDSKADLSSFTNTTQVMDMSHMFANYKDKDLENKA